MSSIYKKYWLPIADLHWPGAWETLNKGYTEDHRAYHSWAHIGDMLKKLDRLKHLATRPELIAAAIFWHDVVYSTQNPDGSRRVDADNVRASAELFRKYAFLPSPGSDAIYDMIMATANHTTAIATTEYYPGFSKDLDLFLDLDLSSLGAAWKIFDRNTDNIRYEYAWVEAAAFFHNRANILEGFNKAGARLFRRDEAEKLWGPQARANLTRSVKKLRAQAQALTSHS